MEVFKEGTFYRKKDCNDGNKNIRLINLDQLSCKKIFFLGKGNACHSANNILQARYQ